MKRTIICSLILAMGISLFPLSHSNAAAKKPVVDSKATVLQNGTNKISIAPNGYKISKVTVQSSKKSVARAAASKTAVTVYGITPGTARITTTVKAKKGKTTKSFKLTTTATVKAPSAKLSESIIDGGKTSKVVVSNAVKGADFSYESINPDVAPISAEGLITGASDGSSAISVKVHLPATKYAEKKTVNLSAGTINVKNSFYIIKINDEIFARIKGKSFKDDCTLPREDLRYLHVLHKNKEGTILEGEMIVNRHIAYDVLEILQELYENNYPIERMRLVDDYDADDEMSMRDNNSSSFNFRFISHTTKISNHGLGLAVDINTLYNPYTKVVDGERIIEPATAEPYLDRDADFDYKIEPDDLCCRLFKEHGFEWGGDWTDRKDYQHFEIKRDQIALWYPENK